MAVTTELAGPRVRQTQGERVEAMRARLLGATIECLVESGYSEMSTNDVVRRAGVSRGALAHHFPSKADLVVAAAERLVVPRAGDFRRKFSALPAEQRTVTTALEVLWTFFDDPTFAAFVELNVAARTNPELAAVLQQTPDQITDVVQTIFRESFPDLSDLPFIDDGLRAIMATFTGLAMQLFAHPAARPHIDAVRALLDTVATLVASTRRTI
jgi:AcrR family transcriptional regulator